jgi:hypothetical protein
MTDAINAPRCPGRAVCGRGAVMKLVTEYLALQTLNHWPRKRATRRRRSKLLQQAAAYGRLAEGELNPLGFPRLQRKPSLNPQSATT